jgi:excisionase family DNA binding protein
LNPYLTLRRHADEDDAERRLCERVEPLLLHMDRGLNCFSDPEFGWLVDYFVPDGERAKAEAVGRFAVGEIIVTRLTDGLVSVTEVARQTGVHYLTIWRVVKKSGIKHHKHGRKKLYDLRELTSVLFKLTA